MWKSVVILSGCLFVIVTSATKYSIKKSDISPARKFLHQLSDKNTEDLCKSLSNDSLDYSQFLLYTGPDIKNYEKIDGIHDLYFKNFKPHLPTVIFISGRTHDPLYVEHIQEHFLKAFTHDKVNLIFVEWRYRHSRLQAAPIAGYKLAKIIKANLKRVKDSPYSITIYGHLYGAIVAAAAASCIPKYKIPKIVGLDPPKEIAKLSKLKLSKDSAEIVEVMHTDDNHGTIHSNIGHRDFYPNNGDSAHVVNPQDVSYFLVTEAIRDVKKNYFATKCGSWSEFKNGICRETKVHLHNNASLKEAPEGKYFFIYKDIDDSDYVT